MGRHTRVVLYFTGWLLATSSGCASWPANPLRTAAQHPHAYESSLSLARLSERHGEPATAEQLYRAVLVKDPRHQVAHHRLAVLATKQQQFDQAQHHFDQATAAGTPDSQLLSDWGYFLYLVDRLPEAETSLRQSLQLDPANLAAHNNLGLVLGTMDRFDESLAEFRAGGNEASAHANLAYVHSLNGDFDQSEAEYHHALQLDSKMKPAAEALLALHARNDPNTADAMAYTPTIPARRMESSPRVRSDQQTLANLPGEMANLIPVADQSDGSSPRMATVSYREEGHARQLVSRAVGAVETTRPLMNLPVAANPARETEPATNPAPHDGQITQPAPTQMYAAPMSVQSLQPQPWQAPTWTAN